MRAEAVAIAEEARKEAPGGGTVEIIDEKPRNEACLRH